LSEVVRISRDDQVERYLRVGEALHEIAGELYGEFAAGSVVAHLDQVRLLAPCQPSKIVGVGWNYPRPGLENPSEPAFFLKPPSAVIGPADAIILPQGSGQVFFEAELATVIKRQARGVAPSAAGNYILGYTCGNDVTARMADGNRILDARAKSYDTFCPLGPGLVMGLEPGDLMIRSWINGQLCQESSTREMIVPIPQLISRISAIMTLEPGDVILTGTPPGAALIRPGDVIDIEIEGIGRLSNPVVIENETRKSERPGQLLEQTRLSS